MSSSTKSTPGRDLFPPSDLTTLQDILRASEAITAAQSGAHSHSHPGAPDPITLEGAKDNFPPHLDDKSIDGPSPFDPNALSDTTKMLLLKFWLLPERLRQFVPDKKIKDMGGLEDHSRLLRDRFGGVADRNMFSDPNIADRADWYSDAVFAQQQFTGVNPTTITRASDHWVSTFKTAAVNESEKLKALLAHPENLYVQDYSHFRKSAGFKKGEEMRTRPVFSQRPEEEEQEGEEGTPKHGEERANKKQDKFVVAPVALFILEDSGKLHPLAIIIDWKDNLKDSVVIFNQSITSSDPPSETWPWRYAKTAVASADWLLHEVSIHLVHTHLLQEGVMVGAADTLGAKHIVRQLLAPHWVVTPGVNKGARAYLVPKVILPLSGLDETHLFNFLNDAFYNFDFIGLQVPNDLKQRGFPTTADELAAPKYHNYGYARNIVNTWEVLHKFVTSVLTASYPGGDKQVAVDAELEAFCKKMSGKAVGIKAFPLTTTLPELINMVTMCIHIATSQHAAINYLQAYYQVFVPNRPTALYAKPPSSTGELAKYTEFDVVKALPLQFPSDWIIASQLPYLLSFPAPYDLTIIAYAHRESKNANAALSSAAKQLKKDLGDLGVESRKISLTIDDTTPTYRVLEPELTSGAIIL